MAIVSDRRSSTPRSSARPAASAASARALRRLTGRVHCARCNDTGSIWMICPEVGAVKLPCDCGQGETPASHLGLADAGLATALIACCGVAYFLI